MEKISCLSVATQLSKFLPERLPVAAVGGPLAGFLLGQSSFQSARVFRQGEAEQRPALLQRSCLAGMALRELDEQFRCAHLSKPKGHIGGARAVSLPKIVGLDQPTNHWPV